MCFSTLLNDNLKILYALFAIKLLSDIETIE